MVQYSEEHLRLRSEQILESKESGIAAFNKEAEDEFPRFKPSGKKFSAVAQTVVLSRSIRIHYCRYLILLFTYPKQISRSAKSWEKVGFALFRKWQV
jgi:hypothetical protein